MDDPFYNPEPKYETIQQQFAVEMPDKDIYQFLPGHSHTQFRSDREDRERMCTSIYVTPGQGAYLPRSETIPFIREDLQVFFDEGLEPFKGYWSVYWASDANRGGEKIHNDEYRSVVSFRTIEFMIRPTENFKNRADGLKEPPRIYIGWRDVQECLGMALKAIARDPMTTVLGLGFSKLPGQENYEHPTLGQVTSEFQWRIDRATPEMVYARVMTWRHNAFNSYGGGRENTRAYDRKVLEYERYWNMEEAKHKRQARNRTATGPAAPFGTYIPPSQPASPVPTSQPRPRGRPKKGKRSSREMGESQELSPSSKRRSMGSHSSSVSQSISAYAQAGGAPTGYLGNTAPALPMGAPTGYLGNTVPPPAPYASTTGSYGYGAAGAGPVMTQYQPTAVSSWSGAAYPPSHPVSSAAATPSGINAFQYQVGEVGSAPGGGDDTWQDEQLLAGSLPDWWDEAGDLMYSDQPYGGYQSGNQGQYGGRGSGSGRR